MSPVPFQCLPLVLLSWNYLFVLMGFYNPLCYWSLTCPFTVVCEGFCCWVMRMSKGDWKEIEEMKKCSSGDVEKCAVYEVMWESQGGGKVLWSQGTVRWKEWTVEGQQGTGHSFQAPKAASSHRETADPTQEPFWQADVSIACLAIIERPGSGGRMIREKRGWVRAEDAAKAWWSSSVLMHFGDVNLT